MSSTYSFVETGQRADIISTDIGPAGKYFHSNETDGDSVSSAVTPGSDDTTDTSLESKEKKEKRPMIGVFELVSLNNILSGN